VYVCVVCSVCVNMYICIYVYMYTCIYVYMHIISLMHTETDEG